MPNRSMTTKFVLELSVLSSHQTSKAISHAQPTIAHNYQCAGGSNPGGGGGWHQAARMHETIKAILCAKEQSSHTDDIAPLALSCMMVLLHITQHLTIWFNSSNVFFPWGFWPCLPLLALVLVDVLLGVGRGLLFCSPGSTFLSSTHGPFGIFF